MNHEKIESLTALLAVGLNGTVTVVATNSSYLISDIEEMGNDDATDLAMQHLPDEAGNLYVWSGTVRLVPENHESHFLIPEYNGTCHLASSDEIKELLAACAAIYAKRNETLESTKG